MQSRVITPTPPDYFFLHLHLRNLASLYQSSLFFLLSSFFLIYSLTLIFFPHPVLRYLFHENAFYTTYTISFISSFIFFLRTLFFNLFFLMILSLHPLRSLFFTFPVVFFLFNLFFDVLLLPTSFAVLFILQRYFLHYHLK